MTAEGSNLLALELNAALPAPPGLADLTAGLVLSSNLRAQIAARFGGGRGEAPRRQRKKLHWEALPEARLSSKPTLWAGAGGAGGDGGDDLIDASELQALFTQETSPAARRDAAAAASTGKGAAGTPRVIYLLDMKRGRNVGIGIKKLRLPAEAVRRSLLALTRLVAQVPGDGASSPMPVPAPARMLSLEDLQLLEELLPTTDEVTLVRAFRGDRAALGEAERFFLTLADVPKPRARAAALSFQCVFATSDGALTSATATLADACAQVRASARLRRVLEATLRLGNTLNAADAEGSNAGDAAAVNVAAAAPSAAPAVRAFSIASLAKLQQTKAYTSARVTLLHYLARRLRLADAAVMDLRAELPALPAAGRLTLEALRGDLAAMKSGLASVERLVREQMRADSNHLLVPHARTRVGTSAAAGEGSATPMSPPTSAGDTASFLSASSGTAATGGGKGTPTVGETSSAEWGSFVDDAAAAASAAGLASSASDGSDAAAAASTSTDVATAATAGESLPAFLARAQARLVQLQSALDGAAAAFSDLLGFFGEDTMSVDAFFSALASFVAAFERADAENLEEEKRVAREARRAASTLRHRSSPLTVAAVSPSPDASATRTPTPPSPRSEPPTSAPATAAVASIAAAPSPAAVAAPAADSGSPVPPTLTSNPMAALFAQIGSRRRPEAAAELPASAASAAAAAAAVASAAAEAPSATPASTQHESPTTANPMSALLAQISARRKHAAE